MSKEAGTPSSEPAAAKMLTASYLEKHHGKKDLVSRLSKVAEMLHVDSTVNVQPDSEDFPGLAAMAACLVDKWLGHKDKDVRLYTVLCCMELFEVYAPEAPWDETEICNIFQQTIRQLANLAHTTSTNQTHYKTYLRILEQLAKVKIGVVLVDVAKNAGDISTMEMDDDDDDLEGRPAAAAFARDEGPLELLAELFKTTLQSLRAQHPPMVAEFVQTLITSCLDEYHGNLMPPYELVDQILICVGQGPTIMVTNPALAAAQQSKQKGDNNKNKKKPPKLPPQVAQPNPSHSVAIAIIRKNMNALSYPVSMLLNGLISGDTHILQRSAIVAQQDDDDDDEEEDNSQQKEGSVDVWTIIYELGMNVPAMLTSIIGTVVSNCLRSENEKRYKAAQLLGQLFSARNSKLATKFYISFREWIGRSVDADEKIRMLMAQCLCRMVQKNPDKEVVSECETKLIVMVQHDPVLDIRLTIVHAVCDQAFDTAGKNPASAALLKAVATKLRSKHTKEHLAVLTGLAQIYYRHYLREGALKDIIDAGDDCDVGLIVQALTKNGALPGVDSESGGAEPGSPEMERNEKYRWIASKIFLSMWYSRTDHEMYKRLVQVVDDLILGSDLSKTVSKQLSPTARAVGFTIIVQSLQDTDENMNFLVTDITSNAFHFMLYYFKTRLAIQKALARYLELRRDARGLTRGSEEAIAADSSAVQQLQRVADMIPGSKSEFNQEDLAKLHACRDKHVFRLLGSIAGPKQTKSSRIRALDELPKRTETLGESVSKFSKTLARSAAMGSSLNFGIIEQCLVWANKCLQDGEISTCVTLLSSVKIGVQCFPSLCDGNFKVVRDMFTACCAGSKRFKNQVAEGGLLSFVTSLLAVSAVAEQKASHNGLVGLDRLDHRLRKQLLQLCTKDGTPQQARHAVAALTTTFCRQGGNSNSPSDEDEIDEESFSWLIKALATPSQMAIDSNQIVSILASLTEFAKRAPGPFSHKAAPVVRFALEGVLLGRLPGSTDDDQSAASDTDEEVDETPAKAAPKRSKKGGKIFSPVRTPCLLENSVLSFACKRSCAAMEFLVCYVSSTILKARKDKGDTHSISEEDVELPTEETLRSIFQTLTQIIQDHGVPPSNRDRDLCKTRADRAALRQCAGVCLLRLCSSSLRLEGPYLSCEMWHTLSKIFLDEEISVRVAVISELNAMLQGGGYYKEAPSLRFMALIVFCADGDHTSANSRANANAANVGKLSQAAQISARRGIMGMRSACDAIRAEAIAKDGQHVEDRVTRKYMPEYSLYYAFHLLTFRRETPSVGAAKEKSSGPKVDEAQYRMLKKRLKALLEPLVKSLETSDNISFLLSMKSVVYFQYKPLSPRGTPLDPIAQKEAETKLKTVCEAADDTIMSFVKTDYDLENNPHDPFVPESLFQRFKGGKGRGTPQPSDRKSIDIAPGISPILARGSDDEDEPKKSPALDKDEEGSLEPSETASVVAETTTKLRRSSRNQPKTASPVPLQINVGTSTPGSRASRKRAVSQSQSSDEEDAHSPEAVKPLGDSSNRAQGSRPKRSRRTIS